MEKPDDFEENSLKLLGCQKIIVDLLINGQADPGTAISLFVRSVKTLLPDTSVLLWPTYYGRFSSYLAAVNLKLIAVQIGARSLEPTGESDIDELFNKFITPIIKGDNK